MIESIPPRPSLPGPESAANADPIHGHEWDPSKDPSARNADLQYACTFPLPAPKRCSSPEDCDCAGPSVSDTKKPVCQKDDGTYSDTQARAKAYPGTRILQVLQGLGDQAVTGSICAAQTNDTTRSDYGYMPVVNALLDRMGQPLVRECLPFALPVDRTEHRTPCHVVEVFEPSTGACPCAEEPGRIPASDRLLTDEMRSKGSCRCEIVQLAGSAGDTCRQQTGEIMENGWCYVDPDQQHGSCSLVQSCPRQKKREIRFPNSRSEPRVGSTAFLLCEQAPITPPNATTCSN
jgi:hypothetical protein